MSIIACESVVGGPDEMWAVNPATGEALDPPFALVNAEMVNRAASAARESFDKVRRVPLAQRAEFLEAIADELEDAGDQIIARAVAESGLPEGRIRGELGRTTGQLRMFAREVRLGVFHGIRHDQALPERVPAPRPDLRLQRIPIGPVAVFGASNFPLAFSTAGGDTASALAAGCPVVVKGHSAHPGTAELAGQAIARAARATGMPAGIFSLVFGAGNDIGQALVRHPAIAAVAFTGSKAGGTALMATAASRPVPIPVYAEMSSINPVVIAPEESIRSAEAAASGFVGSLTLGSGQFCTNPGLLFVPAKADALIAHIAAEVSQAVGQTMLTSGICAAYADGLDRMRTAGASELATGAVGDGLNAPAPALLSIDAHRFAAESALHEEVFGAAGLIVTYDDARDVDRALSALGGQLTASVHIDADGADDDFFRALLPCLERLAGRLVVGGWPTGVEVSDAMVHGGPYPATSDGRSTSVGTLSIDRFLRPVSYQGFPEHLLPGIFTDRSVPRRVDGLLVVPSEGSHR